MDNDGSLGGRFWASVFGVILAVGVGGFLLFWFVGAAWARWGAFGAMLVLGACCCSSRGSTIAARLARTTRSRSVRGYGREVVHLVLPVLDDPVARLGHLVPRARQVAQRL